MYIWWDKDICIYGVTFKYIIYSYIKLKTGNYIAGQLIEIIYLIMLNRNIYTTIYNAYTTNNGFQCWLLGKWVEQMKNWQTKRTMHNLARLAIVK